jgi:hypothetical protein
MPGSMSDVFRLSGVLLALASGVAVAAVAEPVTPAASAPVTSAATPASAAAALYSTLPALPAPPAAFQGLPWGADEAQIAARFGPGLVPAPCEAAERARAARAGELCESPTLPRYEVAGVAFQLTFHLSESERRLVRVTLSHVAEPGADHGRGNEPRWSDHHRNFRRLLSQRYGGPEYTDLQHEAGTSTAQARWRTGVVLIELASGFAPRNGNTPARETLRISYQSPLHGEAAKL